MPISRNASLDAIVIGSGLNGLSAAITLARAGRSVRVYEAEATIGGSARSLSLTRPGFTHDWGATVHALALASPFFKMLPLEKYGVHWVHAPLPFAHPLDDGSAAVVSRSIAETVESFCSRDARAYRSLIAPLVAQADDLMEALLAPIGCNHPLLMARFGIRAIQPLQRFVQRVFTSEAARALFAGAAAHSMLSLHQVATTGYALGLVISAHAYGWPVARGGTQQFTNALVAHLQSLGGEVIANTKINSLRELPDSRAVLCDVTPNELLRLSGDDMPRRYVRRVGAFRQGAGVFKMDWALNAPVPWRAAACMNAGTIHVGGSLTCIAQSENEVTEGRHPAQPFVLAVQASVYDATRAPNGQHTFWAYCHVPNGSMVNMQERMEQQIERFAPGFRDCVIASSVLTPQALERGNANLRGGDISGGAGDLRQIVARPVFARDPYATAMDGVYLCSSSTPPGVGVHGMCGFHAAQSALAKTLR